jgi:hypothetical protein
MFSKSLSRVRVHPAVSFGEFDVLFKISNMLQILVSERQNYVLSPGKLILGVRLISNAFFFRKLRFAVCFVYNVDLTKPKQWNIHSSSFMTKRKLGFCTTPDCTGLIYENV